MPQKHNLLDQELHQQHYEHFSQVSFLAETSLAMTAILLGGYEKFEPEKDVQKTM